MASSVVAAEVCCACAAASATLLGILLCFHHDVQVTFSLPPASEEELMIHYTAGRAHRTAALQGAVPALLRSTRSLGVSLYYTLTCAVPALLRLTALLGTLL